MCSRHRSHPIVPIAGARLMAVGLGLVSCAPAYAQSGAVTAPLTTDRPDFTESALTVPRGLWQLEMGYTFAREPAMRTHSPGELLVRAGLSDRIELRLGVGSYVTELGAFGTRGGLSDSSLGLKIGLLRSAPDAGRTDLALIVFSSLPTGNEQIGSGHPEFGATFTAGRVLNERVAIGVNVGYVRAVDNGDRFDQLTGSVSFGYGISQRLGAYLEAFALSATTASGDRRSFLNAGMTYLITPELQLDGRIGHGLNGNRPDYFTGLGASVRW